MVGRVHRGSGGLGLLSTQYFVALSLGVFVAAQEGLKFTLEDARLLLVCVQGGGEACLLMVWFLSGGVLCLGALGCLWVRGIPPGFPGGVSIYLPFTVYAP